MENRFVLANQFSGFEREAIKHGAEAAQFMQALTSFLEKPVWMSV